MKILIDNAHGIQTKCKRSPGGTLLEYAYTRDLANQILATLQTKGHNAQLLVPETEDIPLSERVRRTNAHCQALGKSNVIFISDEGKRNLVNVIVGGIEAYACYCITEKSNSEQH